MLQFQFLAIRGRGTKLKSFYALPLRYDECETTMLLGCDPLAGRVQQIASQRGGTRGPLLRPAGAAFAASGAHRGMQSKKALS